MTAHGKWTHQTGGACRHAMLGRWRSYAETAERAIRHLAIQRKISGHFFATMAPQYLLLLGLAQTCRFQDKSLLKFLLSGAKDIDAFKGPKRTRRSVAVGTSRGSDWG
jgi:hypothetical protein